MFNIITSTFGCKFAIILDFFFCLTYSLLDFPSFLCLFFLRWMEYVLLSIYITLCYLYLYILFLNYFCGYLRDYNLDPWLRVYFIYVYILTTSWGRGSLRMLWLPEVLSPLVFRYLVLGIFFWYGGQTCKFCQHCAWKIGRPCMVSSFQGNVIIFCQAGIIWANHHDLVEAGF